jgi:phosphate-selective porin OprO/OprP
VHARRVTAARLLALALLGLSAPACAADAAKPAGPRPGWQLEPFGVKNAAAGFELRLSGYLQADFRSFVDWQVGDGSDPRHRAPEFAWRRLRVGFVGQWKQLSWNFDVAPAFDHADEVKSAWLGLHAARRLGLRAGHMKLPVSPEFLTSAAKTDLIERAAVVNALGPQRDWGAVLEGELGHRLEYTAGTFDGDARTSPKSAGTTEAARLVVKPSRDVALGGSFSLGKVTADPGGPGVDTNPKGLVGTSGSGYRFFPGVYVDGHRLRWGVDARWQQGPVALWGEYLEAREQRNGQGLSGEDLPDVRGRGWSATATWLVTGEPKARTMRPRRALPAGPGAIELAARYEGLRFDDVSNQGPEAVGSRAGNIRPAGLRTFTGGVSWWPTIFLRFQGNVLVERYDDALRAPEPGRRGSYVTLVGRAQVHLP